MGAAPSRGGGVIEYVRQGHEDIADAHGQDRYEHQGDQ
jgi:hypothetical protein